MFLEEEREKIEKKKEKGGNCVWKEREKKGKKMKENERKKI